MFKPDTKSTEHKHTMSAKRRLIKTGTERFVTPLEAETQDYRHFLNTIVR